MDDTKKMLRVIINGQSSMKSELLVEIKKVDKKVDQVRVDLKNLEVNLTERMDKLGLQIANVEDDAPTWDDFDKLESRVKKVELKVATI